MRRSKFIGFYIFYGLLASLFLAFTGPADPEEQAQELFRKFAREYPRQAVPEFGFDYRENFKNIPDLKTLEKQQAFFEYYYKALKKLDAAKLTTPTRLDYLHLKYEVDLHRERLRLETRFRKNKDQAIPATGLAGLPDGADWYQFYSGLYTSTRLRPDELMAFGQAEVARVQKEIRKLRRQLGYGTDSVGFYRYLKSPEFYLTEEKAVTNRYQELQKTVGQNLPKLFPETEVTPVVMKPWPNAGPFTPPGYYSPMQPDQPATFYFNFYGKNHSRRVMDWMFLHEGIPGHHFQFSLRSKVRHRPEFAALFYYPANSEGWAAYVENYGKELGLYQTPAQELGKWEWDLVRSARVVLDVGIHAKGWTKAEALAYWKKEVPGQEEIAEREVTRCLNWAGQVLSYKVGEKVLKDLLLKQQTTQGGSFNIKAFHAAFLNQGSMPMEVLEESFSATGLNQ